MPTFAPYSAVSLDKRDLFIFYRGPIITLSNVNPLPDATTSAPSIESVSNVFPIARSTHNGVSVEYAHHPSRQWYVFRASYGREKQAHDFLVEDGAYAYFAQRYVEKIVQGKLKRQLAPLIPNLLFAYLTQSEAEKYVRDTPQLSYLSYYYDHFNRDARNYNPPLIIPPREMRNFVLATSTYNEHVLFVQPRHCHFKSGDLVRVIEGPFCGVEGKVARVAGQQRVVISLSSIGLISTAYIPTPFLQKI